ncbi:MAG: SGNH/GDSL hydrolase family protein [Bacteroidota bacterium]|nr:SGNH/GDSL hydrolase family protein [Bacteroidota bacterium]
MKFAYQSILFGTLISACACKPNLDIPAPVSGDADFSKSIAIGGNYLSGYQDGALFHDGQDRSIPALLARQFAMTGESNFGQNIFSDNGGLGWNSKPWESWFVKASHLNYRFDCEGTRSLGPVKDSLSRGAASLLFANNYFAGNCNFSVPFARTGELFYVPLGNNPGTNYRNPFYYRIASNPGTSTVMTDAVNANATFFSAWMGMEDIYEYARRGGEGTSIIMESVFSNWLDSAFISLTANGAKGCIANIPDFRSFPYYTLIPWNGADLTASKADSLNDIYETAGLTHIVFHEGANGFIINDASAPSGVRQLHEGEYITLSVPLDSMKCDYLGILFAVLPDQYVLDSSEIAFIDLMTASYNAVIAQKAQQYGLAFVDANSYFRTVETGIKWNGVDFNTKFVTGGFYSLDGYHPNQNGYALITNEFIKAINLKFKSSVPTLNCTDCNGVLFP